LSGSLDQSLNNLKSLVTLDLRHNEITGTFPVTLDSIESLDIILLNHNRLTGPLPTITRSLPYRQILGLSHNLFSGNIALDLSYNFSVVPSDFRLQHVDISYNLLSGPISPIFGFVPSFRYFDLSGNNFVGTFPSNVGWESLEFLAAGNNSLTGTVPVGYPTLSKFNFVISVRR
jgi:Leucine-rich repeat (LRR) protein